MAEAMESGRTRCRSSHEPYHGKRYKGINAIHLMAQGYSDQRWMTYKQATAAGAQVRKGEKVRMSILEIH
jgi:antirestriction protein ArdC